MIPITFPECNSTYGAEGWEDVPTLVTSEVIVSCWGMTWRERIRALLTGRVWLVVVAGRQPPVCIETYNPLAKADASPAPSNL